MKIKIHVLSCEQASQKVVAQACIRFMDLKDRVQFSYRKAEAQSPYSTVANEEYQRKTDPTRVLEMTKYIRAQILNSPNVFPVIFPTAMLLACNYDDFERPLDSGDDAVVYLEDGDCNKTPFFIVDGQHRLFSMIQLYQEACQISLFDDDNSKIHAFLEKFEFNCTLLFNFDMWEQGQIFADVNFKQKSVNKSLYYEIYGMKYSENVQDRNKNFIYTAHRIVKVVNTEQLSPLRGKVKMLGTGNGLFSQACLAEALIAHMSTPMGIWYIDFDRESVPPTYRYMTIELISFYTVVSKVFEQLWPTDSHISILCKTTGIQAMVRLMGYLHKKINPEIFIKIKDVSTLALNQEYMNAITPYLNQLKPFEKELFGLKKEDGNYSGTGGKGIVDALFKRMVEIIED